MVPGTEDDADPAGSLRRTTVRGAQLALGGFVLSRGVLFGVYVVLARLVSPSDFGRYAAASVITGIGSLFAESGMMSALIRRRERIDEAASTAFFSLLAGGTLLTLAALAVAPVVGLFFRSGRVTALAAALSGTLLLHALTIVPDALLQRRFSFLRRVAVDPLGTAAFAAASIAACANGAGAWGLVIGSYALMVVELVASWGFASFRPRRRLASMRTWRELAAFARPVLESEILARLAMSLDAVMLGRFKGAATLGQYRNGLRIAQQPADTFVNVGAYVLLPALVRIADQPERFKLAARQIYRLVAVAVLPASLMLLTLGEPLAVLLLGARWRPAGHAVAGLCGLLLGRAAVSVSSEVFKAAGKPQLLVRTHFVGLCSTAAFVGAAAVPFGLIGVAIAVSASQCLTAAYSLFRAGPLAHLGLDDLYRAAAGPAAASAAMVGAMVGFAAAIHPLRHPLLLAWALTAAQAAIGALAYGAALLTVDRPRRHAARLLFESVRAGRYSLRAALSGAPLIRP
jgi:PST family polysaccharide transporter